MSRTSRPWKGAGLLTLGGIVLSGVVALGDDRPPLASQLNDLGRQALAQGATAMAQTFFQKALVIDPGNTDATKGLRETKAVQDRVVKVAFQDPGAPQPPAPGAVQPPAPGAIQPPAPPSGTVTPPPAPDAGAPPTGVRPGAGNVATDGTTMPPAGNISPAAGAPETPQARATLEEVNREDTVARQQLTSDVEQRLQAARNLIASGQPEAALTNLRLAQNYVKSAPNVSESAATRWTSGSPTRFSPRFATRSVSSASAPSRGGCWRRPSSVPGPSPSS